MKKTEKSASSLKILFADDEESLQELMSLELPRMGHEVTVCPDGLTAEAALQLNTYDCLLVDLDMPGLSGIEVIERASTLSPEAESIVLTGKASQETAVAALRLGAFDYLTKPCKLAELKKLLKRVIEKREMNNKYRALEHQLHQVQGTPQLVGNSDSLEQVRKRIAKVAPTNSTVLIRGETGSGKELVARAVHEQSLRAQKPFVAINCGSLPESLIESELFGHRKGAYTGADDHRVGLFEVAHGGTIFLDEIGELPKSLQATLLRVLESGEIRRLGDNESFEVDVRVLCATHCALEDMVAEGSFRQDLMFRINTFEIVLPALRDRATDIPEIAKHLYHRFHAGGNPAQNLFTPEALNYLQSHHWPGNVRELANAIEHATILCEQLPITVDHLPQRFNQAEVRIDQPGQRSAMTLQELEMEAIHEALGRHDGNKPAVAEELGISLKTLYNKINQSAKLDKSA